jgi:RNA polymerase primary sigma factor
MREFKIVNRITNTTDNISRYFNEIAKYVILSPKEEAELAIKSKNGDTKAKELILKSNLRFVVSVAKAYSSVNNPLEDLISEGNKGLVEAIETFDSSTGFKFISYAVWHIRKNIFLYMSNNSRAVRIPVNVTQQLKRYQILEEIFISYNGRDPSIDEMLLLIEDNTDIKLSKSTIETIKNTPRTIPLESNTNTDSSDEDSFSPINWIESETSTDSNIINEDLKKSISNILSELKHIEKEVIILKYGLGENKEPKSFCQIAQLFGRTSEWARGISNKAERRIRAIASKRNLKGKI